MYTLLIVIAINFLSIFYGVFSANVLDPTYTFKLTSQLQIEKKYTYSDPLFIHWILVEMIFILYPCL